MPVPTAEHAREMVQLHSHSDQLDRVGALIEQACRAEQYSLYFEGLTVDSREYLREAGYFVVDTVISWRDPRTNVVDTTTTVTLGVPPSPGSLTITTGPSDFSGFSGPSDSGLSWVVTPADPALVFNPARTEPPRRREREWFDSLFTLYSQATEMIHREAVMGEILDHVMRAPHESRNDLLARVQALRQEQEQIPRQIQMDQKSSTLWDLLLD